MTLTVEVFPAAEWGSEVADRLVAAVAARPDLRLCLPTGSTPGPVYAASAVAAPHLLRHTTVFLLDEFGLPAGDPARCDAMIRRTLIDRLEGPPGRLESLDVAAADGAAECARYENEIATGGLDLTIVGLGLNGHVGLNEPGSTEASRTRRVELQAPTIEHAVAYGSASAPTWGLTMGIGTILGSREIWLLVTGAHKASIVRRTLEGPIGHEVPASYLRSHDDVKVFLDELAAGMLGS